MWDVVVMAAVAAMETGRRFIDGGADEGEGWPCRAGGGGRGRAGGEIEALSAR